MWYHLGTKYAGVHRPPELIVVLGGGGMPSESGLMRTWYAAKIGNHFSKARIVIALPGDTADSTSSVRQMKDELVLRGISDHRIFFEAAGTNTRAQAMKVMNPGKGSSYNAKPLREVNILLVTSPEHLYRAYRTFKKAGFRRVDGLPAFENTLESDLSFEDNALGGKRWVPGIGKNLTIRYQMWRQMRYGELLMREWLAIAYYKVKGWI